MASFIKNLAKRTKTPEQIVVAACKRFDEIIDPSRKSGITDVPGNVDGEGVADTAEGSLLKRLNQMKVILYGDAENEIDEDRARILATSLVGSKLLDRLVENLAILPFEARKHTASIFDNLMRKNLANFSTYVSQHPDLVRTLVLGYRNHDIALNCGTMLRECIRHPDLCLQILEMDEFWHFFEYVCWPNFDVASDALATFRELLVRNRQVAAKFLADNYDKFFNENYNSLLHSENYVTRRQSLKLLGELLLDRSNFNVMMRYISDKENLKTMMIFLKDQSPNIQFEAFHVFKVFVANPNKPDDIKRVLHRNKQKLCEHFESFHVENADDQFHEEKALILEKINEIQDADVVQSQSQSAATDK